jgi:15-hydroxyprostaglandin dehydrogenase (NAD)
VEVAGKGAVVTGAGSGIGRSTALLLASKGAKILVADVSDMRGKAVADEIRQSGGEATFQRVDVLHHEELRMVFAQCVKTYGALDVVFNNAGILTGTPIFPDTPPEQWRRVIELNLIAVIRGTQLAIDVMRQTGGVIINAGSTAGLGPSPLDPVYSASKAGVVFFTRSLAGLSVSHNIRVNCVCPGLVDTPLISEATDERVRGRQATALLRPEQVASGVLRLIEDDTVAGAALRIVAGQEPVLV